MGLCEFKPLELISVCLNACLDLLQVLGDLTKFDFRREHHDFILSSVEGCRNRLSVAYILPNLRDGSPYLFHDCEVVAILGNPISEIHSLLVRMCVFAG